MQTAITLKKKINSGSLTLGALATFHLWPGLVEIAMRAGLDYLIVDLEHLTHDQAMVANICAIGRMVGFPILIRPPAAEMVTMRLAADLGPCGFLVPYVESTEDLDVVQNAIYLKPRGKRRPGGAANRWITDYNYSGWKTQVEDHWIVLPQIESKKGLSNLKAIAAHPLTTAMAMGPYDLSADLGLCWQADNPELLGAIDSIQKAATAVGKKTWAIGDPAALAKRGYTFICVGEPVQTLEITLTKIAADARKLAKS